MSNNHQSKEAKSDRNQQKSLELGAVSFDKQKQLDSSWYEAQEPEMKFLWILDTGGEVDKWRRAGAVIQKDEREKMFEDDGSGYVSRNKGGYVSVIGGVDHGQPVEQISHYLLSVSAPVF